MATSSKVLISVQHLVKEYNHGAVHALNDCNLDIHKGEVVAIIGPSGSGKSTLLRSLNLLEEPTSGAIFFDGADLAGKSVNIDLHRQKMGMVFQHFNLFPHKTVLQNITMAPVTLKKKTAAAAKEQAMALLERIGLADKANEFPNMLSGGQKQRIAIVLALAMDPEVMLFDEPTSPRAARTGRYRDAAGRAYRPRRLRRRDGLLQGAQRAVAHDLRRGGAEGQRADRALHPAAVPPRGIRADD